MADKRYFEFVEGTSNKFWEIWIEGTHVLTRYGKIGSAGQTTTKDEGSAENARKLFDRLVREKTGKGYVESETAVAAAVPTGGTPQRPTSASTKPFDPSDQATSTSAANERLLTFTQALRDALVPSSGECASVQGELVRANDRLASEYFRNGMGNYYEDGVKIEDNYFGELLLFMLDTLAKNRSGALSEGDVAYFLDARRRAEPDLKLNLRIRELEEKDERTQSEAQELDDLSNQPDSPDEMPWEDLFDRAERCIANWCIANPDFFDRRGQPVEERGVRNLEHVFNPPPPAPKCPLCQGRGFVQQQKATGFPELCSCQGPNPRSLVR